MNLTSRRLAVIDALRLRDGGPMTAAEVAQAAGDPGWDARPVLRRLYLAGALSREARRPVEYSLTGPGYIMRGTFPPKREKPTSD